MPARCDPAVYSSLHHDLTQGRRLELEALHGHAVRLGERLGVPTPMLFAVYAALRPHAEARLGEARLSRPVSSTPAREVWRYACTATASGTPSASSAWPRPPRCRWRSPGR